MLPANAQHQSLTSPPNKKQRIVVPLLVFVSFCIFFSLVFLARFEFPFGFSYTFGFSTSLFLLRRRRFFCIPLIMPAPTPKLALSFAVASPRGTDFFDSIKPPEKKSTLHATLVDGSNKIPAMGDISQSFGHRVSKPTHLALWGTDDILSAPKRMEYGIRGFDELNDPKVVGLARLQLLQDFPVGAILLVSSGEGTVLYITVLANPTITSVDHTSYENSGGAPLWEDTFESIVTHP
jgi:hypothetical protein